MVKYSNKIKLDKFYTKKHIAKMCIDKIDFSVFDTVIEPSAGNGTFSSQIPHECVVSYDLEPGDKNIIKKDWFLVTEAKGDNIIVCGNPPFGIRNKLSKRFIKHSIDVIGANTIAFILPNVFSKISNQSKSLFPEEWRLVIEDELPKSSFMIGEKEYHVPCSFYVWTKSVGVLNLRKKKYVIDGKDFIFLKRGSLDADFCVNGNNGKVKKISEVTNSKAEHYIKATGMEVEELEEIFKKMKYDFKSSVNGGVSWIGQQEIFINFKTNKNNMVISKKNIL